MAAAVNDAADDVAGTAQLHDAEAPVNDAANDAARTAQLHDAAAQPAGTSTQLHDAAAQQLLVFPKWYDAAAELAEWEWCHLLYYATTGFRLPQRQAGVCWLVRESEKKKPRWPQFRENGNIIDPKEACTPCVLGIFNKKNLFLQHSRA